MIQVRFVAREDGTVRYAAETVGVLRAMKETAIADARETLRRATVEEGLTVGDAVRKYDVLLGEMSRQYALLPAGEQPRCLANMTVDGARLLPAVVGTFVETFVAAFPSDEVRAQSFEAIRGRGYTVVPRSA
ncbi:hypothetical protein [Kribbella sp. NPDC003557]|uniref:hypothetical protein n=1 Tax=Kribbella sp. NPDC003557 TaxID=3154449 RepID=UPI0033BC4518